jgi:hypothetical protein
MNKYSKKKICTGGDEFAHVLKIKAGTGSGLI